MANGFLENHLKITNTIDKSISENDIIIFTGGLGPTNDDITKKTLNKYFNGKLVRDEITYNHIKKIFRRRTFDLTKKRQNILSCLFMASQLQAISQKNF